MLNRGPGTLLLRASISSSFPRDVNHSTGGFVGGQITVDVKALLSTCKMLFFCFGGYFGRSGYFFFWLFLVFVAVCKLSLVVASGGLLFIEALRLFTVAASLIAAALGAWP